MNDIGKEIHDRLDKLDISIKDVCTCLLSLKKIVNSIPIEYNSIYNNILAVMDSDIDAFIEEIKRRKDIYDDILLSIDRDINFSNFLKCDYCNEYREKDYIFKAAYPYEDKQICDECLQEHFFICENCALELPREEIGAVFCDDKYCKKCSVPKGLPDNIFILESEKVAVLEEDSLDYCVDYNWSNEQIEKFKKELVTAILFERVSVNAAIYVTAQGTSYKIEEFDCRGVSEEIEIA